MNSSWISMLAESGLHGPDAETAFRHILSNLASPTPQGVEALRRHGLEAEDVDPSFHRNVEIFRRLADAGIDDDGVRQLFDSAAPAARCLLDRIERLEELELP